MSSFKLDRTPSEVTKSSFLEAGCEEEAELLTSGVPLGVPGSFSSLSSFKFI